MEKARIVGVMGLAVSVMVGGATWLNICKAQAVEVATATMDVTESAVAVTAEAKAGEGDLAEAVQAAEAAREYAVLHPSEKYPGFVKYIDRLLGYAEAEVIEDEAELVKALNDAALAARLVLGNEVALAAQGEETVQDEVMMRSEVVTRNEATVAQATVGEVMVENATEGAESGVALPKTGEVKKAGVGELILAGLIVAVGTIGATLVIIRDKKRY